MTSAETFPREGPAFQYFGAKWRMSAFLPPPRYGRIVEAFAGSACYATRYPEQEVLLCDLSPAVAGVWRYLTRESPRRILALPDIRDSIDEVAPGRLLQEERWLIGFWVQPACGAPRVSVSSRMRAHQALSREKTSFWGPGARRRLASLVPRIRHWQVLECSYADLPRLVATWVVDPPYQGAAGRSYTYGSERIDYDALAGWVRRREGLVVVHEGPDAAWFPRLRPAGDASATCTAGRRNRSVERLAAYDTLTGEDLTDATCAVLVRRAVRLSLDRSDLE